MYAFNPFCHCILLKGHFSHNKLFSCLAPEVKHHTVLPMSSDLRALMHSLLSLINVGFPNNLLSILSPKIVGEFSWWH